MKNFSEHQRLWFYRVLTLAVTVILAHLLTIWAAPRVIMQILMHGPVAQNMNMHNQTAFPDAVTAKSRSVVMPSPDMLYSVCAYDLRQGPVHVQAAPQLKNYWSIALYAANSDNFFVRNDRQAQGRPVDLWLVAAGGDPQHKPPPSQRRSGGEPVEHRLFADAGPDVRLPGRKGRRGACAPHTAVRSCLRPAP